MAWPGFTEHLEPLSDIDIGWSMGGSGPPLLLLHGFPQTRALWAKIAPVLAEDFTVICPDLRGYGVSGKPGPVSAYTFREMARDQVALLAHLGFERCAVAGHDRGGRVGHRLALDHPECVTTLCVMDIIPTHTLLADLRQDVAHAYYHWFFLAQPEPVPERLIAADPDFYYESCLAGWGKAGLDQFDSDQLEHYRTSWNDPEVIRGMCNDYRATILHDFDEDAKDIGRRLACPLHVLYGQDGVMAKQFDFAQCWAPRADRMQTLGLPGGHFFIDTHPEPARRALQALLKV
ncbi:MAG: alpha/beta hydrolase [Pseudomonadota bacterium]